jgi:hypothetical protein
VELRTDYPESSTNGAADLAHPELKRQLPLRTGRSQSMSSMGFFNISYEPDRDDAGTSALIGDNPNSF